MRATTVAIRQKKYPASLVREGASSSCIQVAWVSPDS
jgi:hypothetical protein